MEKRKHELELTQKNPFRICCNFCNELAISVKNERGLQCNEVVHGFGDKEAEFLIIGEAPGKNGAAITGIPFTKDESGKRMQLALIECKLSKSKREDVFTNKYFVPVLEKVYVTNLYRFYGYKDFRGEDDIKEILEHYNKFVNGKNCKILENEEFGYTRVIVERPLQLNYQVNDERLENFYAVNSFAKLSESKKENPDLKLKEEEEGRKKQEEIFKELKSVGNHLYKNWNEFELKIKQALKKFDISPNFIKSVIIALSEHDDTAEYVLDAKGRKMPDSNLRDSEKIPLKKDIEKYFEKEVKPYYSDAWMDRSKDKIGYEINFTQYFYKYVPPRPLEEIENDIKKATAEIQKLIKEE